MSEHRQGPVRSEAARMDILRATAVMFAERGYNHLTMEGVAAIAGVGKQTIYRWWSSKSALVAESLFEGILLPDQFLPQNTGDIRADLAVWLGEIFAVLSQPGGGPLFRSLVVAAAENVSVGEHLNNSLGASSLLTARLQSAADSGDIPADTPLEELGQALIGAVIFRVISGSSVGPETGARIVLAVLGTRA